jgi:hypothetical protein
MVSVYDKEALRLIRLVLGDIIDPVRLSAKIHGPRRDVPRRSWIQEV